MDGLADRDPNKPKRSASLTGGNTGNLIGSYQSHLFYTHDHGGEIHSHSIYDPGHVHSIFYRNGGEGYVIAQGTSWTNDVHAFSSNSSTTGISIYNSSAIISASGGLETRPINVYVNYVIKY